MYLPTSSSTAPQTILLTIIYVISIAVFVTFIVFLIYKYQSKKRKNVQYKNVSE